MTKNGRMFCAATLAAMGACSSSSAPGNNPGYTTLASVTINPRSFNLVVGDTARFTATAKDNTGATVSATLVWGAFGGTVTSGLFTAAGTPGGAKVWVTAGGTVSDTATGAVVAAGTARVDTIFSEDWEANSFAQWTDRGLPQNQAIITDATVAHSGSRALEVTFPNASDGGWLTHFFMPGYDSAYARYWVFIQPGWKGGVKLISFYGSRTDNAFSAAGKAGVCPSGTDFFIMTLIEDLPPGNPALGPTHFYSQYPGMPQTPAGSGTCYGDNGNRAGVVTYTAPLDIAPGAWHLVEFTARLNTPGQSNSYEKFCIDGVVRGVWPNNNVRSSSILMLNSFTITNSISGGALQTQRIWVDDILVTRQVPPGAC